MRQCDPRSGTCRQCGQSWSLGDYSEPAYGCDCPVDGDVNERGRPPGDDDGVEYADPATEMADRLTRD